MPKTKMIDGKRIAIRHGADEHAHCCRGFVMSRTYGELKESHQNYLNTNKKTIRNIDKVWPMLKPLGWFDGYMNLDDTSDKIVFKRHYRYNCKHLHEKTGKCLIYENRPDVCKNYGSGLAVELISHDLCEHSNCASSHCEFHKDFKNEN